MKQLQHETIGDLAVAMPDVISVFRRLNIDFCCGGGQRLDLVLEEQGLSRDQLMAMVGDARRNREVREHQDRRTDFAQMSPPVLAAYLEDTHHQYLRQVLPEIQELLPAVLKTHGRDHRELFEVASLFGAIRGELEPHLIKEELLLFPAPTPGDAGQDSLIGELTREHRKVGALLLQMGEAAGGCLPPAGACHSYRHLYSLLSELEEDLRRHIHLENNVLFRQLSQGD